MKKWISVLLACCIVFTLTGCGNKIPDLSEKEMNMVTEYAAGLLLKYDANYQSKLLDDEALTEAEELQKKVEEAAALRAEIESQAAERVKNENDRSEDSGESGGESAVFNEPADLASFLDLGQVSVSCNGVEFKDSYPDSGDELVFAIQASPGRKLAVVHFYVTNNGSSESSLDMIGKNASFRLALNGGSAYGVMYTLLDNDFALYQGNIQPGQTLDLVLLADIPEEECTQFSGASLSVQYNGTSIKVSF
ncbi:MAG: hypothetical protein J1E61_07105 [Lachnospiraceae bacterium]|nr:hypothetical protein [Lachnospiraceae bacterium]